MVGFPWYFSDGEVASRVLSLSVDECITERQTLQPPVRITLQQRQVCWITSLVRDLTQPLWGNSYNLYY